MLASNAPIFAAKTEETKEVAATIKTEPEEYDYEPFQATDDVQVEKIKAETLLYADHEITDEIVIGPTVISRPVSGSQKNSIQCSTTKQINMREHILFSSKIQLRNVANELWCNSCDKWCLTSAELQCHKKTHVPEKNTTKKNHDSIALGQKSKKNGLQSSNENEQNIKASLSCDMCDQTFSMKVNLKRHKKLLHTEYNQILSCSICDKKFTSRRYLVEHIKTHDENKRKHCCDICKKSYDKKIRLDYHLFAVHKSGKLLEELLNPCKVCDKDLSKPSLWKHKYIHRGEHLKNEALTETIKRNKNLFLCHFCNKIFYKRSCLNYHKALRDCAASVNVIDKSYIAGYYTTGRKLRGRSKLIRQGGKKNYRCDICNKTFWTRYEMRIHFNVHNSKFTCDHCKKNFVTKLKLAYHVKIHDKGKLFSCDICKKSYVTEHYLQRHQIVHTNAWSCKTCEKQFYCKSMLGYHLKNHAKLDFYYCDVCNKKFCCRTNKDNKTISYCIRGREGMVRHTECHKSESFTCNVCKEVFPNEMDLLEHVKCHSENLYVCEICNEGFKDENHLNQHLNVHI